MAHAEGNLCTIAAKAEWRSSVLGSEDALQAKPFTASGNVNGGGFRNGTLLLRGLVSIGEGNSAILECGVGEATATDYRRGAEDAEEGKRFNAEGTEEGWRTQRKRERSPPVAGPA